MVRKGQVVGLVGRNGIGKSTALKILAGQLVPNLGDYEKEPTWDRFLSYLSGREMKEHFERIADGELRVSLKPQAVYKLPEAWKKETKLLLEKMDERKAWTRWSTRSEPQGDPREEGPGPERRGAAEGRGRGCGPEGRRPLSLRRALVVQRRLPEARGLQADRRHRRGRQVRAGRRARHRLPRLRHRLRADNLRRAGGLRHRLGALRLQDRHQLAPRRLPAAGEHQVQGPRRSPSGRGRPARRSRAKRSWPSTPT